MRYHEQIYSTCSAEKKALGQIETESSVKFPDYIIQIYYYDEKKRRNLKYAKKNHLAFREFKT